MASTNKCWKKQTKLEKLLIVFVVILSCVVLVLFTSILSTTYDSDVCNNAECVRGATKILDFVDHSVDPCDNFYNFVCGTFLKNAFSTNQATALQYLYDLSKNQLKEIVVGATNEILPNSVIMQRKFYRSCMNTTAIDEDNNKTFLELLNKLGGWPILKSYSWNDTNFDWVKTTKDAKNIGLPYNFFLRVIIHAGNNITDKIIIRITPPIKLENFNSEWKESSIEIMKEIATTLGWPNVGVVTELRRTMHFAEQLKNIVEKAWNNSDNATRTTIKNLDFRYVKIVWLDFLKNITNVNHLTEDDEVVFEVGNYLNDLYYLLLKTPKRIQANYISWYIVSKNMMFLSTNIREKYRKMNPSNKTQDRKEACYKKSIELFKYVAEAEYIRRYSGKEKKEYIIEMTENIKNEFKTLLESTDWMDEKTKKTAIEHLENIKEVIGWAEEVYNVENFENFTGFDKLNFASDNIINMTQNIAIHETNNIYKRIHNNISQIHHMYYYYPKLDVNAYYEMPENQIILPAPILQGLLFNTERPHYMNYGSMGSIIGHETTHGITFSTNPKSDDNLYNWYTNQSIENYKNQTNCILEEYEYFTGHKYNYKKIDDTIQEYIADFTGLLTSYRAYQKWIRHNGYEEYLPGLNYTPNQIFWIMSSIFMCSEPKLLNVNAKHPDNEFRVNSPKQNLPYFARDFNCAVNSKMNPKNKCQVFF